MNMLLCRLAWVFVLSEVARGAPQTNFFSESRFILPVTKAFREKVEAVGGKALLLDLLAEAGLPKNDVEKQEQAQKIQPLVAYKDGYCA